MCRTLGDIRVIFIEQSQLPCLFQYWPYTKARTHAVRRKSIEDGKSGRDYAADESVLGPCS